jgi:hypothetical protein
MVRITCSAVGHKEPNGFQLRSIPHRSSLPTILVLLRRYMSHISVTRRIAFTSLFFAVGVVGVAVSPMLPLPPLQGFIVRLRIRCVARAHVPQVCLASIVVVGIASSLVLSCYFPPLFLAVASHVAAAG